MGKTNIKGYKSWDNVERPSVTPQSTPRGPCSQNSSSTRVHSSVGTEAETSSCKVTAISSTNNPMISDILAFHKQIKSFNHLSSIVELSSTWSISFLGSPAGFPSNSLQSFFPLQSLFLQLQKSISRQIVKNCILNLQQQSGIYFPQFNDTTKNN